MALIKRKQIDLYIQAAPDGTYGLTNLSGIGGGSFALTLGDQYETVVDKIVSSIDTLGSTVANSFYTYTVNGISSKNVTFGGSVDFGGTTNQITVSKVDSTNGVDYTFALPSTLVAPGSVQVSSDLTVDNSAFIGTTLQVVGDAIFDAGIQVAADATINGNLTAGATNVSSLTSTGNIAAGGTLAVTGASTLTGAVDINNTLNVSGNVTLDGAGAQTLTHTGSGNLTISSTNGNVLVEGTTFNGNTITVPGAATLQSTLNVAGNVTLSGNSQTITHSGTGNLTMASTGGSVIIEGTTFTGNDVAIAGNLSVVGSITQTTVNDLTVADRFIKLANGNNGTVTLTGVYQQLNTNSFAGSVYSTTESMFRFFTTTTEPTTSTTPSSLTPATIDFGGFGPNATEALQDAVNAFVSTSGAITKTYNDPANTLTIGINYATVAANLTLTARAFYDGNIDNLTYQSDTALNFAESDTAIVKLTDDTLGLKVVVRGHIQEDLPYAASATAGRFTVDANGNATLTLSHAITVDEFVDNVLRAKEQIQVFINGVKCRWTEFAFAAGSTAVIVYSGNSTPPAGNTGVGYALDSGDLITVIYYGDQDNDAVA